MTNSWTDIKNTDLVVIMGGNAAEAHPCGFKWVTEAKANRGAKLIVVDPRFTRSASVADYYAPIRQGTDIAFLLGVINHCMQNRQGPVGLCEVFHQCDLSGEGRLRFTRTACSPGTTRASATTTARPGITRLGRTAMSWPMTTLQNPRCVWNLLKQHVSIVYAGNGRAHLRHAEGQVPQSGRDDRRDVGDRQVYDVDVCARLDPAFQGRAEHPHHGDAACLSWAISVSAAAA